MHDVVSRGQTAAIPVLITALQRAFQSWEGFVECLPIGVFAYDRDGTLVQYNRRAAELWGRAPKPGDSGFRIWDAYRSPDGTPLLPSEAPLNCVLSTGQPVRDQEVIIERPDGSRFVALINADPLFDADGALVGGVSCFQDITARKQAEARQALLIGELNHRVKNTLAIIQAIASQSLQHATSLDEFRATFQARVMALSHAHDLLTNSNWDGAYLGDILDGAIMPFRGEGSPRLTTMGDRTIRIGPQSAAILAVAFHELATNAAKHGALSNDVGRVAIAWTVNSSSSGRMLQVSWTETGGPPVARPSRTGFGLKLIEKALSKQLANVRLDFAPEGLAYSFEIVGSGEVFG